MITMTRMVHGIMTQGNRGDGKEGRGGKEEGDGEEGGDSEEGGNGEGGDEVQEQHDTTAMSTCLWGGL